MANQSVSAAFEMPSAREIELDLALASPGWQSLLRTSSHPQPAPTGATHAIVIGGGIAGLVAASVLAGSFDRVTIVDRDSLPAGARFRDGVPQSRHLHGLLRGGLDALEDLFPGIQSELLAAGAVRLTGADFLRMSAAGWAQRFDGPALIAASRELIEWGIRRRTLQSERIRVLQEHEAAGLIASPDGSGVVGVRLRPRRGAEATWLNGDLVVDATGRTSKAPEWLDALGYGKPKETLINSFLGYASCLFAIPPRVEPDWKVLMIGDKPPAMPRAGVLAPIEGGRWMVTLGGYGRDYPPTDREGFMEFARSLRSDLIYRSIKGLEPLTRISGFRSTMNQRRHFEAMSRWPEGFVVVGDAACAFNPVYGQGMTVAAKSAIRLKQTLRDHGRHRGLGDLRGLARLMQGEVGRTGRDAWLIATGADVRYPTTEGRQPGALDRVMQAYLDRVIEVSLQDATVSEAFLAVVHLLDAPASLFRPKIAWRALTGTRRAILESPPARRSPVLQPASS